MDIKQEVVELVADVLGIPCDRLPLDVEMDEIPDWDSIKNVIVLSRLEERFDATIPEDDVFELTSVRAIVDEIVKLKSNS